MSNTSGKRHVVVRFEDGSMWISKGQSQGDAFRKYQDLLDLWAKKGSFCLTNILAISSDETKNNLWYLVDTYIK